MARTNGNRAVDRNVSRAEEFALCRTIGHQWKPSGQLQRGELDGYVSVKFMVQCANCPTTREDFIDPRYGELVARRYRHPDGYLMTGIEDRPTRTDFRRVFVRKAIQEKAYVNVGVLDYRRSHHEE